MIDLFKNKAFRVRCEKMELYDYDVWENSTAQIYKDSFFVYGGTFEDRTGEGELELWSFDLSIIPFALKFIFE